MPDNFTPQTAFEGFVAAKLDNMEKRLDSLPCSESFGRIGKCENDIANMKGKATATGAFAGFVTAIITKFIFWK